MTKSEVRQRIWKLELCRWCARRRAELARLAAEAVCAGGIPIVEITMTVPGAIEVIAEFPVPSARNADWRGHVPRSRNSRACLDAGAQFLVSPGFDAATVEFARQPDVLVMAGALTATEVITALERRFRFRQNFSVRKRRRPSLYQGTESRSATDSPGPNRRSDSR